MDIFGSIWPQYLYNLLVYHSLTILTEKKSYNLQVDQLLRMIPSLQMDQVVQPYPALQIDQRDQDLHGVHEDHPYQRDRRSQGDRQYPERVRVSVSVCEGVGFANTHVWYWYKKPYLKKLLM